MGLKKSESRLIEGYQTLVSILQFNEQGLMPTIVQDAATKQVLTLCYLNHEALEKNLSTGKVHVFRRSQNRLMLKGETSGHTQLIKAVHIDCEGKSLLLLVTQRVAACHTGHFTCYFRKLSADGSLKTVGKRVFDPAKVY